MSPAAYLRARRRSFGHALRGVVALVAGQPHARVHLAATAVVVGAAAWTGVGASEWAALALATGLVWAAEALNTAVEALADALHPEVHDGVKRAKDVAAAGVLLASAAAAGVGLAVFLPRVTG